MEAYHPLTVPLAAAWRGKGVRSLSLAASRAVCRARLGDLLVAIQQALPEAEIGLYDMSRDAALSALDLGHLDAAVMPGDADPRFRSTAIWQERVALRNPMGRAVDAVTLDDLVAIPLVVSSVPEERAFHDFAIEWLFDGTRRLRPGCSAHPAGGHHDASLQQSAMLVPMRDPAAALTSIDDPRATIDVVAHWRELAPAPYRAVQPIIRPA